MSHLLKSTSRSALPMASPPSWTINCPHSLCRPARQPQPPGYKVPSSTLHLAPPSAWPGFPERVLSTILLTPWLTADRVVPATYPHPGAPLASQQGPPIQLCSTLGLTFSYCPVARARGQRTPGCLLPSPAALGHCRLILWL